MSDTVSKIIESWACKTGAKHTSSELMKWIEECNKKLKVEIKKADLFHDEMWEYSSTRGIISNKTSSFFMISGIKCGEVEQPIMIQNEIGYLGILCQEIDGILHLLMQAKIEPGNINKIQISPTIQATKSNFTQKHGGNPPAYLNYFLEADKHEIVVDQIQSEQSSRFLSKRNRNIIIIVDAQAELEVLPNHHWMTLGQIKQLMKHDNLVNMDTRTVISCIPFHLADSVVAQPYFQNYELYRSVFFGDGINHLPEIYQQINNNRMFEEERPQLISLQSMTNWVWKNGEFICKDGYHFKIVFCDISIEGREVKHWTQPLFEAIGMATFGLLCCEIDNTLRFVVKCKKEIGSFDGPELGPTVQLEAEEQPGDELERFFFSHYKRNYGVRHDVILSEEGGRFYHEQNRNIILNIPPQELPSLPNGYFLVDYKTLSGLVQVNNILNIQLRNLMSLLEV